MRHALSRRYARENPMSGDEVALLAVFGLALAGGVAYLLYRQSSDNGEGLAFNAADFTPNSGTPPSYTNDQVATLHRSNGTVVMGTVLVDPTSGAVSMTITQGDGGTTYTPGVILTLIPTSYLF